MQVVLNFIPKSGVAQTFLHHFRKRELGTVDAGTISHIVEDGFRKRIGALKHHADTAAKLGDVLGENVLAVQQDFAF